MVWANLSKSIYSLSFFDFYETCFDAMEIYKITADFVLCLFHHMKILCSPCSVL